MNSFLAQKGLQILYSLPIEWAVIDTSYQYKFISEKWKEAYHILQVNETNASFFEITPLFLEEWITVFNNLVIDRKSIIVEKQFIKSNGVAIWLKIQLQTTVDDNNNVDGIIIITENITQQKREQEILENTNKVAKVGGWEVDLESNTVFWSTITKEIHGVDESFLPTVEVGLQFYKEGSHRNVMAKAVQSAIEYGLPFDIEVQIINAANQEIWVRSKGNAEHRNGKCIRLFGTFQDITKEKLLQDNLVKQEKRFRSTFENAVLGVAILSLDCKWMEVNESFCTMVGYTSSELIGNYFHTIIHAEDFENYQLQQEKLFNIQDDTTQIELRLIHKNKSIVYVLIAASVVNDENGIPVYFTVQIENISKRKEIEQNYLRSELKYRKLYELLPVGVSLVDHKTRSLVEFNDTVIEKLGYSREEFQQLTFRGISVEGFEESDNEQLQNLLNKGKYGPYEKQYYKKDGTICTLLLNGIIIDDGSDYNENKLVLSTLQDITEIKEKEKQLVQLNQLLDHQKRELQEANIAAEQFNYVASHDLNEPLRMITGFLELLQKKYSNQLDEKASTYIHFALDGSRRMQALIKDLLQYSRIGKEKSTLEQVDLSKVIAEVKQNLYRQIVDNKAIVETYFSDNQQLWAYPISLIQLFQNLISNAIKFKKVDAIPTVKIFFTEQSDAYLCTIEDNGIGMPLESQQRIFDVFTRLHSKNEYAGTGIGLAICKKIIDKHKGKIWVESTENVGSTFYFTISKQLVKAGTNS